MNDDFNYLIWSIILSTIAITINVVMFIMKLKGAM